MKSVTSVAESNFQNIGRDMAERLGLGPEVRELKLGPSFTHNKSTAFHTLKYDFKPASVDVSKMARVDVGTNNTMTVTVPHLDGAGVPHTVFKGSQRPYHKECVLIIDRITGEITLEKLSANVQVKKTRTESKNQLHTGAFAPNVAGNGKRPITPIDRNSPPHVRATGRTKVASGKKREPTVQLHPKQPSPLRASPYNKSSPNVPGNSSPAQIQNIQQTSGSLPFIGLDCDDFPLSSSSTFQASLPTINPSTRNPSSVTNAPPKPPSTKIPNVDNDRGALSDSSSSSSSSDSSDSDTDAENIPVPMANDGYSNGFSSSPMFVPDNLLNDDLQLSESESDHD